MLIPQNDFSFYPDRSGRDHRLLSALSVAEKSGSVWLLVPAAFSLMVFAWLLSLHPAASDRVYAAYGGYIWPCRSFGSALLMA